jgi:glycosyltransferase involved in cell wall biosynthesis
VTGQDAAITDNRRWAAARPVLSVLIPFKNDDPRRLLGALDAHPANVEVIVLDDGTGDAGRTAEVTAAVEAMSLPARLVTLARNEGRSKGRNRLVSHARGGHFLFLDSDMVPDADAFLDNWVSEAARGAEVVFGGFSLIQLEPRPEHALHRAMATHSDCLTAEERRRTPEKYVFTSNLLVRRDVFEAEAFDEGFAGWGWEDVEWGMRVARRWPIGHIDNTATHLGLDTAPAIAAKYEQSAANFARVIAAHPQVVSTYPSYRVARLLKRAPLRHVWRPMLKALALFDSAPVRARAFAMRLYRAALYAEAV